MAKQIARCPRLAAALISALWSSKHSTVLHFLHCAAMCNALLLFSFPQLMIFAKPGKSPQTSACFKSCCNFALLFFFMARRIWLAVTPLNWVQDVDEVAVEFEALCNEDIAVDPAFLVILTPDVSSNSRRAICTDDV